MEYVYAFTDHSPTGSTLGRGIDGSDCYCLVDREIAVVASPAAACPRATGENVWRHELVVEALMAECTVLPVRFGTLFADSAALLGVLRQHDASLDRNLQRVRGRVELGLHVLWDGLPGAEGTAPVEPEPVGSDGRAYMLLRLRQEQRSRMAHQRAEEQVRLIAEALRPLAIEWHHKSLVTPGTLLQAAYLVKPEDTAEFQARVQSLAAAHAGLSFLCTGPWPPYSFTEQRLLGAELLQMESTEHEC